MDIISITTTWIGIVLILLQLKDITAELIKRNKLLEEQNEILKKQIKN